tara:strand:- start:2481 stop:3464 length:984 start_codon:yes stop_codon:yes gene_type:complete
MAENDQAPVEIPAVTEADLPKGNPANVDRYNAVVEAAPAAVAQDTATIDKARADGWAPKDHWRGDPAEWVDAAEFNARGPIMKKMNAQSSALAKANAKMAKLEAAMEAMAETNQTIMNKDTEEVLGSLKQQRADAISVGNGEKVNELDDEIEKFKTTVGNVDAEREAGVADVAAVTYPDEFYQFEEQNSWYATQERVDAGAPVDWEMTQITDTLAQSFYRGQQAQGKPEPTPAEALVYVQNKLQVMYPDKFNSEAPAPIPNPGNVRQPPPSILEPNGEIHANPRNLQNAPKVTIDSLPFEEQKMIRKMADGSNVPVQDYLDQMQERG